LTSLVTLKALRLVPAGQVESGAQGAKPVGDHVEPFTHATAATHDGSGAEALTTKAGPAQAQDDWPGSVPLA